MPAQPLHQLAHVGIGGQRVQQGDELAERGQDQAQPDEHAPEVVPRAVRLAEQQDAYEDERRREGADVERQDLDDERRADIRAQHHGERGRKVDQPDGAEAGHHQGGGGAALQQRRDPQARGERAEAAFERLGEQAAQVRAEHALDARFHHVDAPQQKGDSPRQTEER